MAVCLLTSCCNTANENLSQFFLNNLFFNGRGYNHTKLVSLDIVNMFPNIDNQRGIQAIQDMLNTCAIKNHLQLFNRRTQVVSM